MKVIAQDGVSSQRDSQFSLCGINVPNNTVFFTAVSVRMCVELLRSYGQSAREVIRIDWMIELSTEITSLVNSNPSWENDFTDHSTNYVM